MKKKYSPTISSHMSANADPKYSIPRKSIRKFFIRKKSICDGSNLSFLVSGFLPKKKQEVYESCEIKI